MVRFELTTPALRKRCSAVELHRRNSLVFPAFSAVPSFLPPPFDTTVDTTLSLGGRSVLTAPAVATVTPGFKEQSPCPRFSLPVKRSRASPIPTSHSSRTPLVAGRKRSGANSTTSVHGPTLMPLSQS